MKQRMYRTYRRTYGFNTFLGGLFTKQGFFIVGCFLFCVIVGGDARKTMIFQIGSALAAFLTIGFLSNIFFSHKLSVSRLMPKTGMADEPFRYRLQFYNNGKLEKGLFFEEVPEDPRPDLRSFLTTVEPSENKRNAFDKRFGYYRWMWLIKRNLGALFTETELPVLFPATQESVESSFIPQRRGYIRFKGIRIIRKDIFGLTKRSRVITAPASVLIFPKMYAVPKSILPGTRKYQEGETALIRKVGDSEEFLSIREYQPGDPLKRIHWRSFAKLGKPMVKETQDQFASRHALILDTFSENGDDAVFEDAVSIATSFVAAPHAPDVLLDLLFVGTQSYCMTCGRGAADYSYLMEILACVIPASGVTFTSLSEHVMRHVTTVSGCIMVLLTLDPDRLHLVRSLAGSGMPLDVYICTNDPDHVRSILTDNPLKTPVKIIQNGLVQKGLSG